MSGPVRSTVVVKCGGRVTEQPELLAADIARLRADGVRIVLVHGGSSDIDGISARLGIRGRRIYGPGGVSGRYTDDETLAAVLFALAGAVKPRLVTALAAAGVDAVGLTGLDLGLVRARRKRPYRGLVEGREVIVRDDHSGRITGVSTAPLRRMIDNEIVGVLSPPALADDGTIVNVDADRFAAAIAVAIGADRLVLLSGVEGLRADADDPGSVLTHCVLPTEGPLPFAEGGMGAKLGAAREALHHDVPVQLGDGRIARPVSSALAGGGTRLLLSPAMASL